MPGINERGPSRISSGGLYINQEYTMIDDTTTQALPEEEFKLTERQLRNFWRRVNKSDPDKCWLWTGNGPGGSGACKYGHQKIRGHFYLAHRLSWIIKNGPVPIGDDGKVLCVLHRCDVPLCVNPAHLFTGTKRDNIADMDAKGRRRSICGDAHHTRLYPERLARGERSKASKLTEAEVIEIRRKNKEDGLNAYQIALLHNTCKSNIYYILQRRAWAHIP